ncbi:glutamate-1-semialdehyde-2,1-aminomutase [Halobacteroides halobius DSM 5150]|uniref:Glutamate-1-semialdehyde 2,1-aminomutase n=1 Tax=Halobacteroides halobius (strain ATCC 35273 / DSM 5150 / MD-1) TaxID=748449 RepID=L0K9J0_HALHC|nr:glutamate-1-semialdehyde 2,1-aminomutase [Halobacteroides halobius]AGB41205.1 glutamate-1-semialdehyde-2,1-aminomutase [Halobacteroides halobius DSM 5150]
MSRSKEAFKQAKEVIPGGVNSPARAFAAVDSDPLFIEKGTGALIYDIEGNEYIDYVGSWGPMILGYNHPQVIESLQQQLMKGTSFGAPTEVETELAKLVIGAVDSIDQVRMVNSGTEATMSALRLARGYTGKDKIIKLKGCYHGHGDSLLVEAGSGVTTLGISGSPGVPDEIAEETIVAPYNNLEAIEEIYNTYQGQIAAVILEPVTGNMGVIRPQVGYLEGLREITATNNSLLIFDEVMTGFRLAYGGAQELYEIEPDITTLGKIIGGGLPVGAYGGKKEIMEYVAPAGPVYQAGTLSGNPLAMAAGIETLKLLQQPGVYSMLEEKAAKLEKGFKDNIKQLEVAADVSRVGSMFSIFFTDKQVIDYKTAKESDTDAFTTYFKQMLAAGIYLPPSQFESNFVSLAHVEADLDATIEANYNALAKVKKKQEG